MTDEPRFDSEMECVHCDGAVDIPLVELDGREDHWLHDGQALTCDACGGVNRVMCDTETEAYFADCDEPGCAACGLEGA